ncbi:MAG: hypothetical protein QGF72_04195 [Candidatus Poseidoniaceae archaeon]|nr:hypothetical protein [Candidatus Poseidoniaceae archaeon]
MSVGVTYIISNVVFTIRVNQRLLPPLDRRKQSIDSVIVSARVLTILVATDDSIII